MFDYFGISYLILIVSWFTNKIFYVFWLIPLYGAYLIILKIWGFMGKSYQEEEGKEEI